MAILVRSGVPLIEALHIGAAVTTNLHIQQNIIEAADRVTEGASLSSQLEKIELLSADDGADDKKW